MFSVHTNGNNFPYQEGAVVHICDKKFGKNYMFYLIYVWFTRIICHVIII